MIDIAYQFTDERADLVYGDALKPQTNGSAAIDVRAMGTYATNEAGEFNPDNDYIPMNNVDDISLEPGDKMFIGTGLSVYIKDPNYAGLLMPRSSASRIDLMFGNTVGLIDSDYQGTLIICVRNIGANPLNIEYGSRIGQLVIIPIIRANYNKVDSFDKTTLRGQNGFGSTGVK